MVAESIAAGLRAAAEGLQIVEGVYAAYGLKPRHGPGPAERAWRHRERPVAEPELPVPVYGFLTEWDTGNCDGARTMLALARATRREQLRRVAYRAAAEHLVRLRFRSDRRDAVRRDSFEWAEIAKTEIGLSRRRAYEIVATLEKKPLETLRKENTERKRKARKIKGRDASRTND